MGFGQLQVVHWKVSQRVLRVGPFFAGRWRDAIFGVYLVYLKYAQISGAKNVKNGCNKKGWDSIFGDHRFEILLGYVFQSSGIIRRLDQSFVEPYTLNSCTEGFFIGFCPFETKIPGSSTLLGTNISSPKPLLNMIFLLPRWDMLVPWRVLCEKIMCCRYIYQLFSAIHNSNPFSLGTCTCVNCESFSSTTPTLANHHCCFVWLMKTSLKTKGSKEQTYLIEKPQFTPVRGFLRNLPGDHPMSGPIGGPGWSLGSIRSMESEEERSRRSLFSRIPSCYLLGLPRVS